jgi:N-acetylglutamate synthase-like GNAT family acetyltransferase
MSVAVRPDVRGKGLGQLITAASIGGAMGRGITHIYLFTETARSFFEGLGFVAVERRELPLAVDQVARAAEECPTATAMVFAT